MEYPNCAGSLETRGLPDRIVAAVRRNIPLALLDVGVIFAAYLIPLVLRFEGSIPDRYWNNFLWFAPAAVATHLLANYLLGLYGEIWRYASVQEARRIFLANAAAGAVVLPMGLSLGNGHVMPFSAIALGVILAFIGIAAIRFQSRLFGFRRRSTATTRVRVLIFGAGDAGALVLKDILHHLPSSLDPVGFIDDDPRKVGRAVHGVPVLGTRAAIPSLVGRLRIDQVLLAIPSAPSTVVRDVATICEEAAVGLKVLPSLPEIVGGTVTVRDIRDLRIEDLLGRQQVHTDLEAVAGILRGRRILVTGAGGSIGAEISRQVAGFEPAELLVLDHDETHLHDLLLDLDHEGNTRAVLADIRDRDRVFGVFAKHRPEVVFHAAAHKHVPLLEAEPQEALLTNVIGTANVADAAAATGTERFVLISTDKAIRPVSVMGASKRFAEQIVRSLDGNGCAYSAVRFGNVLGSRGSVIPTFLHQIARGGPVTVTDPSMTRYFMSAHEAVQLVLQAAAQSRGGEVFTLDMGEPISVIDLARKVIRLSGRVPDKEVGIAIVGPRPGEKLVEEIVVPEEEALPRDHPSIVVSRPALPDRRGLKEAIRDLEILAATGRTEQLVLDLKAFAAGAPAAELAGEVR